MGVFIILYVWVLYLHLCLCIRWSGPAGAGRACQGLTVVTDNRVLPCVCVGSEPGSSGGAASALSYLWRYLSSLIYACVCVCIMHVSDRDTYF